MRIKIAVGVVLFFWGSIAHAFEKPRLAVLASEDERTQSVVALVEVSLASRDDVTLIDRSHIDKVLAEQRIQKENMVSNEDRLVAARLIGCDIFAELRVNKKKSKRSLVMRALDAGSGVRLIDVSIDASLPLDEQASATLAAISNAVQKIEDNGTGKGIALSISEIREVGLPVEYRHLPQVLQPLLERNLLLSPGVSLLDRERLELLNAEATVAEDKRKQLLVSTVRVDVDLSSSMNGDMRIRASLKNLAGNEIGQVAIEGRWHEHGKLILDLAEGIAKELTIDNTKPSAKSLLEEAELYIHFYESSDVAVALTEGALAMDPLNIVCQNKAMYALERSIVSCYKKNRSLDAKDSDPQLVPDARVLGKVERILEILEMRYTGSNNDKGSAKKVKSVRKAFSFAAMTISENASSQLRLKYLRQRLWDFYCKELAPHSGTIDNLLLLECASGADDYLEKGSYLWKTHNLKLPEYSRSPSPFRVPSIYKDLLSGNRSYGDGRSPYPDFPQGLSDPNKQVLLQMYEWWCSDTRMKPSERLAMHFVCARWVYMQRSIIKDYRNIARRHLLAAKKMVLGDPELVHDFGARIDWTFYREAVPCVDPMIEVDLLVPIMRQLLQEMRDMKVRCRTLLVALDWYDQEGADYPGMYLDEAIAQYEDSTFSSDPQTTSKHGKGTRKKNARLEDAQKAIAILNKIRERRYGNSMPEQMSQKVAFDSVPLFTLSNEYIKTHEEFVIKSPPSHMEIVAATLYGENAVYMAIYDRYSEEIGVIACDIQTGHIQQIGGMTIGKVTDVNSLHVNSQNAYILTDKGLVIFPLARDGAGVVLNEMSGFPGTYICDLCEYDNMLYIACIRKSASSGLKDSSRGTYLVRCGLDGENLQMLAASVRAEKLSPLDDSVFFEIPKKGMVADPANHQILFSVHRSYYPSSKGIWTCDAETGHLKQITRSHEPLQILGKNQKDEFVLQENSRYKLMWHALNPSKKKRELMSIGDKSLPVFRDVASEDLPEEFPLFNDFLFLPNLVHPKALTGGYNRWTRWERCEMTAKSVPYRKTLPGIKKAAPFFLIKREGQLIACTKYGLYTIDPKSIRTIETQKQNIQRLSSGDCDLTISSKVGGFLSLKDQKYIMWPNRPLRWRQLPAGTYHVAVDWYGRSWTRDISLKPGEKTTLNAFSEEKADKTFILDMGEGVNMTFVWVPNGESSSDNAQSNGVPVKAHVEKGFWVGQYEVTANQRQRAMQPDKPIFKGDEYPAVGIDWDKAVLFCEKVNQLYADQLNGRKVRLPTKEEWDYAFWAGVEPGFTSSDFRRYVHDLGNKYVRPIGVTMPNLFFLHDMLGNAREWCSGMDQKTNRHLGTISSYPKMLGYKVDDFPLAQGVRLVIEE